jgi:hypothetical protein
MAKRVDRTDQDVTEYADKTDDGVISGGNRRPVQLRKKRPDAISKRQLTRFLEELAACRNVRVSASAAGFSVSTAYRWRLKDEVFRQRWEAALLEQARLAADGGDGESDRVPVVGGMDAKLAFALLQNHQRFRGKQPDEKSIRRSELPNAVERLERALNRFGRASAGKTEADPVAAPDGDEAEAEA